MVLYKEFKVGDLLTVSGTKSSNKGDLEFVDDGINFVGRTNEVNGIQGTVSPMKHEPNEGNTITISQVGTIVAKYQPEPYYTSQNIAKLGNDNINRDTGLYMASVINKALILYEGYNTPKLTDIKEIELKLPVKSLEDTEPDWEYMEVYIKQKELAYIGKLNKEFEQKKEQLIKLIGEETEYINIEELPTAKFKIGDLFTVESTKSLDAGKLTFKKEGINFVGRTGANNGVQGKIGRQEFEPNEPNTITATVIGNLKYVKYQQEYYYTSQNINKLTAKYSMGIQHIQYFITHIKKFVEQYNGMQGGYKLKDIREHEIEVIVNPEVSDLVPDWNAMERYIARIELQLLNRITNTLNT